MFQRTPKKNNLVMTRNVLDNKYYDIMRSGDQREYLLCLISVSLPPSPVLAFLSVVLVRLCISSTNVSVGIY